MQSPLPILLMTRPRAQAEGVVRALRDKGARFREVYAPLIGVASTGDMPAQEGLDGLIFTSANGVRLWIARSGRRDLPCVTVGDATARAASESGMEAQSAQGDAEALIARMSQERPEGQWLHVHGTHSRGNIAERLSAEGLDVTEAVIYDQPEIPPTEEALTALAGKIPVIAPLYSPRTAALFARLPIKAPLLVAGLSPAVVKPLSALHIRRQTIASRPDSDAMQTAVLELLETPGESVDS
ncbi:uroporphyrinogen-III synthase [Tropicibacter sp. S64]|uniref:uroporphyrinogen-III synthase n=1 Tax=Tropicibacter sp. S64 TaxID=3415122 RepID=UPI003C7A6D13